MEHSSAYQPLPPDGDQGVLRIQSPKGSLLPPLSGRILEAVYVDASDLLIFLTHDILHEEQLDICLLREEQLVDRLSLGQMFQPAEFGNLRQIAPRRFTFTFPADMQWQVEVDQTPKFTLPDLRRSVSRMRMWQSYFTLTRSKPS